MGTLFIDKRDIHVKLDGGAMAFYANGKREGMVPIAPLERVIVIGNIVIETSVLNRLVDDGVSVLFLSGRKTKYYGRLEGKLHKNALLRLKQYKKSISHHENLFPMLFSCEIVERKIKGEFDFLKDALEQRQDLRFAITNSMKTLEKIKENVKDLKRELPFKDDGIEETCDDINMVLMGFEGSAASSYFSAYTMLFPDSLNFKNRNRRPPLDPVNSVLSLCYTLLHYEFVREIEMIGLDPFVGFYHQFDYGRESLACDLVELYRVDVDRFVWQIFRERSFTERDFIYDKDKPGCYMKKSARERFYFLHEEWSKNIRPNLKEEVRILANRINGG
ncbi:MAG TPA: CRISPR-associated endonuclease Cas1 [Syntrophorhabdaceae bacterium]|nr:CRISPR-associated endonuclease Cas1 [Syntrophorhabdaceae bacterium]